ncbi:MAG: type II/IV secretion system protein, partial [Kiritimatiellae bacterium]|nr:type II/IV secretion system protein [Kiritimatiellia bacterium]
MRWVDALEEVVGGLPADRREALDAAGSDREASDLALTRGWADRREIARAWASAWKLEYLESLPPSALDVSLVRRLPVEWARAHHLLPVRWNGRLCALAADPCDLTAQEDLARMVGDDLHLVLTSAMEVERAIDTCYADRREESSESPAPVSRPEVMEAAASGPEDLLRAAEGAPVTQWVNRMLLDAVRARASDIHIEPTDEGIRVRFRVDGMLHDQAAAPRPMEPALVSRLKVMARLDIAERRLPQDGMARVRIGSNEMDIRVSTVPIAMGERVVLRLLNHSASLLPLEDLGLETRLVERLRAWLRAPMGIILVTGPTGSGKTTTLYAALREIDTRRRNVITIEDPIEYQLPGISQIQVNPRIDLTFARCLRHVLRQDPDVILVGETRDLETAEIAIRASLTGHLVFTTLHTNDAASAALRLTDMGVEPYLLASSLRGVLAQRLVRRLCPRCREPAVLSERDVEAWGGAAREYAGRPHWRARGCSECREGYAGRIGLFEMIEATPDITEAIHERARPTEIEQRARR